MLDTEPPSTTIPAESSRFSLSPRWFKFLSVLVLAFMALVFYDSQVAEHGVLEGIAERKEQVVKRIFGKRVTGFAEVQKPQHDKVKRIRGFTRLLKDQREQFFDKLQQEYGPDNFSNMFFFEGKDGELMSRGRVLYTSTHGKSWFRLKRKFLIKILEATLAMSQGKTLVEQGQQSASCDGRSCYARFLWANGGHSSSAGHGNFFQESYTAVMEQTMKPVFAQMGISFEAKNMAMGGTSSGEEIALCTESIFGRDVDVLTWDYGMTDSGHHEQWKQLLYIYHTAMGKNRPASIGIDFITDTTRDKINSELEALGMTVFHQNKTVFDQMKEAIPDTLGLTDQQVTAMPPYIQQLKCNGAFEKGEPGCRTFKYNMTDCTRRKGQTTWHPGWKMHALNGNALSLFLIEVLMDAVKDLSLLSGTDNLQDLLDRYLADEEEDYANVLTSHIPDKLSPIANWVTGQDNAVPFGNMNLREWYQRRSFCHTALLPAEMRYKGLLTQARNTPGFEYDTGIVQPKPDDSVETRDGGMMRLAYDPNTRNNQCKYNTGIDYKDFFFLSSVEGWKSMTIPNDDEKQFYNIDAKQTLGMILVCLAGCDWDKCNDGDLRERFDQGPLTMHVNDIPVVAYTKVGVCWALKNEANIYRWAPNADGKFLIKGRVDVAKNETFSFVRFSSFILI